LRLGLCPIALYRRNRLSCKVSFCLSLSSSILSTISHSPPKLIRHPQSQFQGRLHHRPRTEPMCLHIYITYSLSSMRRDHPATVPRCGASRAILLSILFE
jgi:hypothetical protein